MAPKHLSIHSLVLVVDLDGTVLRTDLLVESFWSALRRNWCTPFSALIALWKGKASLKEYLSRVATIDATTLPYDEKVLAYVREWRQGGGKTALVTGSHQILADDVASHLGIFDEVHGSQGATNLIAKVKADFAAKRYGRAKFAYIGDAVSDLPIWQQAAKAITVNARVGLRRKVEETCEDVEHLSTKTRWSLAYFEALRPHQWVKNLLVFAPLLASHLLNGQALLYAFQTSVCFSVVASSIYLFNDLMDIPSDRAHPRKRLRPFASGTVSLAHGFWMGLGLLASGLFFAALIDLDLFLILASYVFVSTGYTLYLKRIAFIDLCVLAILYNMRIYAGGAATDIEISGWLLTSATAIFICLGAVKRQTELVDCIARGQSSAMGRGYRVEHLSLTTIIAFGAGLMAVIFLTLYSFSPEAASLYAKPEAFCGISAIILFWLIRLIIIARRHEMHDDPISFGFSDSITWLCFITIFLMLVLGA